MARSWHLIHSRLRSKSVGIVVSLFLMVGFIYVYSMYRFRYPRPIYAFSAVADQACDGIAEAHAGISDRPQRQSIPNLIHYVWLLQDPAVFSLNFKAFISIYSANIRWKPERIYLHTDASAEVIALARRDGDLWTRRILGLPGITLNYVTAPLVTSKGIQVVQMEHKSDFVRLEVLRDFGGVYLDMDCVPLRSISNLLDSGYANVVGGQAGLTMRSTGYLDNGIMMAVPHSVLMTLFHEASHKFFDGRWTTASTDLLTDIAKRLHQLPSEVLILHPDAFAPVSWELEDVKRLFLPQRSVPPMDHHPLIPDDDEGDAQLYRDPPSSCLLALAWLQEREATWSANEKDGTSSGGRHMQNTWELDLSSSYILHAFDDELRNIHGWDRRIDVPYVLDRRSNYARIVFPAVWSAIQAGIIPVEEATTSARSPDAVWWSNMTSTTSN